MNRQIISSIFVLSTTTLLAFCSFTDFIKLKEATAISSDGFKKELEKIYVKKGDINIGMMFTLLDRSENDTLCGGPVSSLQNYKNFRASVYHIDQVNKLSEHGLKFGLFVVNDCDDPRSTLLQTIRFALHLQPNSTWLDRVEQWQLHSDDIIAVIGAGSSDNSIQAARLLGLYQIPQINYLSTSDELSNQQLYPYFRRIVPSDAEQAYMMMKLMYDMDWKYVIVFYSSDDYGENGYGALVRARDELFEQRKGDRICIASRYELVYNYKVNFSRIMADEVNENVTVFVSFTNELDTRTVLEEAYRTGFTKERYKWLISEGWGNSPLSVDPVFWPYNAFTVTMTTSRTDAAYNEYFTNQTLDEMDDPWSLNFFATYGIPKDSDIHSRTLQPHFLYAHADTSLLARDAIDVIIKAVGQILQSGNCDKGMPTSIENLVKCVSGPNLLNTISDMTFTSDLLNENIGFVGNNGIVGYKIMLFSRDITGPNNKHIATYDVKRKKIDWIKGARDDLKNLGLRGSHCSQECGSHEIRVYNKRQRCCWQCAKPNCEVRQIILVNGTCQDCPDGETNDSLQLQCLIIQRKYLKWIDLSGIMLWGISITGLFLTAIMAALFVKNKEQELIKATSREISYIILAGITLSYVFVIIFVFAKPKLWVCFLAEIGFSLATTLIYGPLLVKLIRLYRVFRKKDDRILPFIQPFWQIIFSSAIFGLHVILIISILLIKNNQPKMNAPNNHSNIQEVMCIHNKMATVPIISYDALLLLLCVILAFQTRRVHKNFNESKFIGYTTYTTSVVWAAFLVSYFIVVDSVFRTILLSLIIIWNASITLALFYGSRIYAVYRVKGREQNVRRMSEAGGRATALSVSSLTDMNGIASQRSSIVVNN